MHMPESGVVARPDADCRPIQHGRPVHERTAVGPHRQQRAATARSDQPQPLGPVSANANGGGSRRSRPRRAWAPGSATARSAATGNQGTRRPADRKLPQPLVHHRRRLWPTPVLEPQIINDQARHLVPDRRTAAQGPAFPTVGTEVVKKHTSSKAGPTDSPD